MKINFVVYNKKYYVDSSEHKHTHKSKIAVTEAHSFTHSNSRSLARSSTEVKPQLQAEECVVPFLISYNYNGEQGDSLSFSSLPCTTQLNLHVAMTTIFLFEHLLLLTLAVCVRGRDRVLSIWNTFSFSVFGFKWPFFGISQISQIRFRF